MKKLCTLLALLVAAPLAYVGCSDYTADGVKNSAEPTYVIFGKVTDTAAKGLPGVEVCFNVAGKDVCTKTAADNAKTAKDEAGTYVVKDIPFDSEVTCSANLTIPAVKADEKKGIEAVDARPFFPVEFTFWTDNDEVIGEGDEVTYQDNIQREMNLTMVEASYTATGYVFANGVPATGATVVLDLRWEGFPIYTTATVDADGMFTFEGLPASSLEHDIDYEIYVLPFDKDGDGMADFEAVWSSFDPFWAAPNKWVFNLADDDGYMDVRYSNVEDGRHTSADPIVVVFNQVITSADIQLTDETRYHFPIAFTYEIVSGIKLVITPVGPLSGSSYFTLSVTGRNSANGNSDYDWWSFRTGGAADVEPITGLALQNPKAKFDLNDECFDVTWTTDPNANEYCVYAMNNGMATDWNRIQCYSGGGSASPADAMQMNTVCIPDYYNFKFDSIKGDDWFTALEGGTEVTLVVTGINFEGSESPIAGADTLTVGDTVIRNSTTGIYYNNQSGSANNTGNPAEKKVKLYVNGFYDYMDRALVPTITFTDGPDANTTVPAATWVWDNDARNGWFEFTVAADATEAGDTFSIDLTGMADTSGNAIANLPAPPAIPPAATDTVNEARLPSAVTDPATVYTLN